MDEARIRKLLEAHRRELAEELGRLTEVPRDPPAAVSFGKRIGDGTTEAVERIATTAAARSLWAKAQEVDRALAKLAERTYGICDGCGKPIPHARLEAMPWAVLCVACSAAKR